MTAGAPLQDRAIVLSGLEMRSRGNHVDILNFILNKRGGMSLTLIWSRE